MEEKIAEAPLKQKRYVYSDVGFILLGMLVEQLAGMPMEAYLQREFYEPMGLEHTGYLPLRRFAKSEIVPSNKDRFLRKETLQDLCMMRLPLWRIGRECRTFLYCP